MKRKRVAKTSIGVRSGCVCLRCPHCGTVDLIAGEISGHSFMRRWNAFRRKHDWRCAIEAQHSANLELAGEIASAAIEHSKGTA